MIKHLSIKNYKSIKGIDIHTKRVNVFIGEHNSGKSNLLEALSWFSINALNKEVFPEMFRFKTSADFFFDFDTSTPLEIKTDTLSLIIRYAKNANGALLNNFEGLIYTKESNINPDDHNEFNNLQNQFSDFVSFTLSFDGIISVRGGAINSSFRTYIFKRLKSFVTSYLPFLNPPFGENIPSLLLSNKHYKDLVSSLFKEKGFRLMLKPNENDMNMAKDTRDELYSYPYNSISETLQRIVFYLLAIESNKNTVLVTDEPESNTFPMYTKQLAEVIAHDKTNQYFITTHNPYMLDSLVSKTPKDELSVFVTRMDDYMTTLVPVPDEKLSDLLDKGVDFYFNLDKLVD